MFTRQRITTSIALVVSVAALTASTASAMSPYAVGPINYSGQSRHDSSSKWVVNPLTGHKVLADVASSGAYSRQDKQMLAPASSTPQTTVSLKAPSSGSGLPGAAIAAAALALTLLLLGGGLAASRKSRWAQRHVLSH